jgi:hypothetical protein
MITFKILGKKYPLPTRWEDLTYTQYLFHLYPRTLSETVSCFTGIPRETLERSTIKGLEKISLALAFMTISPKFERTPMVGKYVLPADITIQSLGQFEDLRGLLKKLPQKKMADFEFEDHEKTADLYLTACAIYLQKVKDGAYDYTKVAAVKEELRNYPCTEVIGTGAFFLYRQLNISPPLMTRFLIPLLRLKKLIQGLPGYQKTLDFLLPSRK